MAFRAVIDGQCQSPVALLRDHPIVHIAQPIQFSLQAKCRNPCDLVNDIHDFVAQLVHRDVPFIYQAEYEFGLTTPADGITVLVVLWTVEQAFLGKVLCDLLSHIGGFLPGQPIIAFHVNPKLIDRRDDRQVKFLRECKIFATASGSDMYNACTLGSAHLFPGDDCVNNALFGWKFVEWTAILPTNKVTTYECFYHMVVSFVTSFESLQY